MVLLGLTGNIGSGKSTLIDAIMALDPSIQSAESSTLISAVANAMNDGLQLVYTPYFSSSPEAVSAWLTSVLVPALQHEIRVPFDPALLDVTPENIKANPSRFTTLDAYLEMVGADPNLLKTPISPANKSAHRPVLQWIGGFVTESLGRSLWYEELVRQARVAEAGGCTAYLIGGVRFSVDADIVHSANGYIYTIERPGLAGQDNGDLTERYRSEIRTDGTIINDGTPGQLAVLAADLYAALQSGAPKPVYRATDY